MNQAPAQSCKDTVGTSKVPLTASLISLCKDTLDLSANASYTGQRPEHQLGNIMWMNRSSRQSLHGKEVYCFRPLMAICFFFQGFFFGVEVDKQGPQLSWKDATTNALSRNRTGGLLTLPGKIYRLMVSTS